MAVRRQPAVGPTGATGATGPAGTAPAGTPVLRGPYVVDYTDIPHDGDTTVLWTPQVGDVVLRLFPAWQTAVDFAAGATKVGLYVGQNVDASVNPFLNSFVWCVNGATFLDNVYEAQAADASGIQFLATAYVCPTADPITLQHSQIISGPGGGAALTQGHVALYALVARAVAP